MGEGEKGQQEKDSGVEDDSGSLASNSGVIRHGTNGPVIRCSDFLTSLYIENLLKTKSF